MNPLQITTDRPGIQPDVIFHIGNFPVSNSLLMIVLILLLCLPFIWYTSRRLNLKPSKLQNAIEVAYNGMYNLIYQLTGSDKYTQRLFPLIAGIFVFIGLANLLSIVIPFLTSITYRSVPIFRTPTADFNTPFALAVAIIIMIQIISIKKWGILKHMGQYFQFKQVWQGFKHGFSAGMMAVVNFLIGLLDIISEIAKVVSLSVRLFGNMFAGEMLAIIIIGFLAIGLPAVWMSMSLLVGVIQAMVFGALTAAYYMLAVEPEE